MNQERTSGTMLAKREQLFQNIAATLMREGLLNTEDFTQEDLFRETVLALQRELDGFSIIRGCPLE